jgi:hypothetical protein
MSNLPLWRAEKRDVVLFSYGGVGEDHGAELLDYSGLQLLNGYIQPRYATIWECNYKTCQCGTRVIEWSDPTIKGIYRPL